MNDKKTLSTRELMNETGIKKFQIDYLVMNEILPPEYVKCKGHGRPREYEPEAIELVNRWIGKNQ